MIWRSFLFIGSHILSPTYAIITGECKEEHMTYFMPTQIIEEEHVVAHNKELFAGLGDKVLIVTGRNSAKINGALKDVQGALEDVGVAYEIYDQVLENPPFEQLVDGAQIGLDCDFVIGIGGGSPLDVAKGIALLIKNPTIEPFELIYKTKGSKAVPVIAIPTTGGTGSETTPYAVYTDKQLETKTSMTQRVFPLYALLDVRYYMYLPKAIRNSTCVDALTHSIESYMNTNATKYSDYIALESIRLWGEHKESLLLDDNNMDAMKAFMTASTLAGMAISQTGTSIPHSMGYPLTYYHGLYHGAANAVFTASYLNLCKNKWKVATIIETLGFESVQSLGEFIEATVGRMTITDEEIDRYSDMLMSNERKLKNHPDPITKEDVVRVYKESVGARDE